MHKLIAFSCLFISSLALVQSHTLAEPLKIPHEIQRHLKNELNDEKHERRKLINEYNWEMCKAIDDFKTAGKTFGVAVGASALFVLLMRKDCGGLACSGIMNIQIGGAPLAAWAALAMTVVDAGAVGYSLFKTCHGVGHLIEAHLKKSSLEMALKYE